jgi:SAM-dependent methyltransferase
MDSDPHAELKSIKHTALAYDLIADRYAEVWFAKPAILNARRFLAYVPSKTPILDVGCGPGQYTKYFSEEGHQAVGIDVSLKTLSGAKERCPGNSFVCMDMARLGFASNAFGGVWACASVVHVPAACVRRALEELNRVLRAGGAIFVNVQKGEHARIETPEEFGRGGTYGRFFQRYRNEGEFLPHLTATGFEALDFWENSVTSEVLSQANDRTPQWLNFIAIKRCLPGLSVTQYR